MTTEVTKLVVHHSAAWHDDADGELRLPTTDEIQAAHLARSMKTTGYHAVIDRAGRARYFRRIGRAPAANGGGNNAGTYAVCAIGWNGPTAPVEGFEWTPEQFLALSKFIRAARLLDPNIVVCGHRDLKATICPGLDVATRFADVLG